MRCDGGIAEPRGVMPTRLRNQGTLFFLHVAGVERVPATLSQWYCCCTTTLGYIFRVISSRADGQYLVLS